MWRRWWMRSREGESWRRGFGCPDVEGDGGIARDTVGVGEVGEVEVDLDSGRKTGSKRRGKRTRKGT